MSGALVTSFGHGPRRLEEVAAAVRARQQGALLDQSLEEGLREAVLSTRASALIRQIETEGLARTIGELMTGESALKAVRDRGGPIVERELIDVLQEVLSPEWTQGSRDDDGLSAGMDDLALRTWAESRGIADRLSVQLDRLNFLRAVRGGDWVWRHGSAIRVSDAVRMLRGPRTHTGRDRIPETVQRALLTWLRGEAARVRAALQEEAAGQARWAALPEDSKLKDVRARLLEARKAVRAVVVPRSRAALGEVETALEEDPPVLLWREAQNVCGTGLQAGTVRISCRASDGLPIVSCDCPRTKEGRCPGGLAALDAALDLLVVPEQAERRVALIRAIGTPPWAHALRRLSQVADGVTPPESDERLLGWRVKPNGNALSVEPLVCRPKRRGEGYVVERTLLGAIEDKPYLTTNRRDADVTELLRPYENAESNTYSAQEAYNQACARALALLVGHPRVFDSGATLLPVVECRVQIKVVAVGTGFRLRAALDGEEVPADVLFRRIETSRGAPLVRCVGEPARVQVTPVLPGTRTLLESLARDAAVVWPAEALGSALEPLLRLQGLAPVLIDPAFKGVEAEADSRPMLRLELSPDGGLRLDARVQPLVGGPSYVPGEGPDEVLAQDGGVRRHVRRDRAREPDAVLDALGPLQLPETDTPYQWWFGETDAALGVIARLQNHASLYKVTWTTAARRRVTRAATASDVRLQITQHHDWFGLSGTIEVDGISVPISAALDAVRAGQRFVTVNDEVWLQLTEALVERLAGVAAATDATRLEINALTSLDVLGLGDDGASLDAPKAWTTLRSRIVAAQSSQPPLPAGLLATLRGYQREGYTWMARLAAWGAGGVLADDMGLGKTVQALALLLHRAADGPALVVAPTSVGFNWAREAARFAPGLRVLPFRSGSHEERLANLRAGDVVITSYDLLVRNEEAFQAVSWGTLIFDEAQALKNPGTRRMRVASALQGAFRLALTGTPVENRLSELWSLFRVIAPGLLGSWDAFRNRFAQPIERDRDPGAQQALARLLRPFVLRRLKTEVARELPSRTEITLDVALSADERALYEQVRLDALSELSRPTDTPTEQRRFRVLAALTRLRQLACHPRLYDPESTISSAKLELLRERVAELREEGHRALIFSQFTRLLALVQTALQEDGVRCGYLDGSTPAASRQAEVDAFQRGEGDVFLISLKAGGTGLNLTAATYVIHLDPWWNPAVEDQATDRTHRIGQHRPVTVYRLVAQGTLEEAILALHAEKRALASAVLDGTGAASTLSTDELLGLLQVSPTAEPESEPEERPAPSAAPAAPPPPKAEPPPSAEPPPPARLSVLPAALDRALDSFQATLNADVEDGLLSRTRARLYRSAVRDLLGYANPTPRDVDGLQRWSDAILQAVDDGRIPLSKDHAKVARPAVALLLGTLEAEGWESDG